ncbi:Protein CHLORORESPIRATORY REDUCTION 6, chloroplastic [Linum perenne]
MAQKINNLFLLIINLPCQPPMSSMASTIKPVLPSQQFIVSTNSRWKFSRKSILPCLGMKNSPLNCSRQVWAAVSFDPSRDLDLSLFDEEESSNNVAPPPMPRKEGRYEVVINNEMISKLDLSAFHNATGITSPAYSGDPKELLERTVGFTFNYVREDPRDPREVSEFPDIRLWFVRLDSLYPWLPVVLDWRAGELARYAALLVPHQMMWCR